MFNTLDADSFLPRFGIETVWENLKSTGFSTHSTVITDLDNGDIRSLLLRAKKLNDDSYRIRLKYFYHHHESKYDIENLLELRFKETENGGFEILSSKVRGEEIDASDPQINFRLGKLFSKFTTQIIKLNEWVNPLETIRKSGLQQTHIGRKALPGLYANGDFKSGKNAYSDDFEPVYPALFLPALIGVSQENYNGVQEKTNRTIIYTDGEEEKSGILQYRYKQGKSYADLNITGTVEIHTPHDIRQETVYDIQTRPDKDNPRNMKITSLQYLGQKINLKDPRAVSSILKIIRNTNRLVRAQSQSLIDDLKKPPQERRYALPTELSLFMGAYEHLNTPVKIPKEGLLSFTAPGGPNRRKYLSDSDTHIGANQNIVTYEFLSEDGHPQSESIMIDAGVLFHEIFSVSFFNAARYLQHKTNKLHKPEHPAQAIFFTHLHEDHVGQLAYLVKKGYKIPVLIMNGMTKRKLERSLKELDIKKPVRDEIMGVCHVVDFDQDVNPQNPEEKVVTKIAGTTIEQWTEKQPGEKLGGFEYYPVMKIGRFNKIRIGPMPHSAPGMMFDFITDAGSIRLCGDGKSDETSHIKMPSLKAWLKGHQPDSILIDSLGANRTEPNPLESEVEDSILHELTKDPEKCFVFVALGSNEARLASVIAAIGRDKNKNTLIIDGKAVEDLVRDADKVKELKAWAEREHEVELLFHSQKAARNIVNNPELYAQTAIYATGPHDEILSSISKASRNSNDENRYSLSENYVVCFVQGCIPVPGNHYRRLALKDNIEFFHGARVVMPETVDKEAELYLKHGSGHNDPDGIRQIIRDSGQPCVLPAHGNGEQLDACAALAEEEGAEVMQLLPTSSLRIQKGKKVSPYKIVPSELIGVNLHTPSPEKFYLKGRFSLSVMPIAPELNNPASKLLDEFEDCLREKAGRDSKFEMARIYPISLSRVFNAQTVNGYLTQDMPFGIDKYKGDVFEAKNIGALGFLDTETGGLDHKMDRIREFSMNIQNAERETLENIQIFQRIDDEHFPSAFALLVTGTDPFSLRDGLAPHEFVSQMDAAIKSIKRTSFEIMKEKDENTSFHQTKAICAAHNMRYDARMMGADKGLNLDMDTRTHQTRGIIALDTRTISRALAAFCPDKYFVTTEESTGLPNHRLLPLCEANGIEIDESQAHGGDYDKDLCGALFWKQYEIDKAIVSQMIINADSSTSHLLNDMMGMDTGFGGPHPVFAYLSPSASRPYAQLGCAVGTMDCSRYVVVFNLNYDPNDYMHLPASQISRMLSDYDCDVFEVLDLRKQPVVMPARMGFRAKANGSTPKETFDRRAGVIKRHLNYTDPDSDWKTIAQKIEDAWEKNQRKIYGRINRSYTDDTNAHDIDYVSPLSRSPGSELSLHEGVSVLRRMRAKIAFNQTYKKIHQHLREYLKLIREDNIEEASAQYKTLIGRYRHVLGPAADTINYVHSKLKPEDLSAADSHRTKAIISAMKTVHYRRFVSELHELENNPDVWDKYIGDDKAKKILYQKLCKWRDKHKHYAHLSNESKHLLHPHANDSRPPTLQYINGPQKTGSEFEATLA